MDAGFNSGIQFRSAVAADTMRWDHQAGNGDRFVQTSAPGRVYGSPVATLRDTVRSSGFIALQVHSVGTPEEAGRTVRFRGLSLCAP